MKRIASVAVMAGDRLLIGKRSDDQRWNLPGGHVDEGETPEEGAARELEEETGISVDPERLMLLREPQQVTTFTGKQILVHSYLVMLPDVCETHREGTDPGEAHDWSWTNVSKGLPPDIAQNWHNKTDATMEALGLIVSTNDSMNKSEEELYKAWPKEYNRVKGQTSDKGVASKKQYRYMQAKAAEGDKDAKDYLSHSPKGGEGLPESGTGGSRGERGKGKGKKDKAEKAESSKVITFGEQVANIKNKYKEKKPKDFKQQVSDVKERYKKPLEKKSDLFYAKIEGLLEKGFHDELLVSQIMDAEVLLRKAQKADELEQLYKSSQRLFDSAMSAEEQTVYELSYLARSGDPEAEDTLAKFVSEMYDELLKHTPIEDAVAEMVKSRCWDGYEPVPGKKPYSDGSCREKSEKAEKPYKGYDPKKNHKEGGLSVAEARRQGIRAGVETKREAEKKGGFGKLSDKTQARRKSFCSRMCGMRRKNTSAETARDPKSKINASLRVWGCKCNDSSLSIEDILDSLQVAEAMYFEKGDEASLNQLYDAADSMFDEYMTPSEQTESEQIFSKSDSTQSLIAEHERLVDVLRSPSHKDDRAEAKRQEKELEEYKDKAKKAEDKYNPVPDKCPTCKEGKPKFRSHTSEYGMNLTWWDCPHCETTGISEPKMEKSADNSKVVGKKNGHSVRKVHGYYRYTSGPKRGEYVHRHEAEKRLGRKLGSKEHVDHKDGNRGSTKNTKVMSASSHAAKTNKSRSNDKGYSGKKRYEHTRD